MRAPLLPDGIILLKLSSLKVPVKTVVDTAPKRELVGETVSRQVDAKLPQGGRPESGEDFQGLVGDKVDQVEPLSGGRGQPAELPARDLS